MIIDTHCTAAFGAGLISHFLIDGALILLAGFFGWKWKGHCHTHRPKMVDQTCIRCHDTFYKHQWSSCHVFVGQDGERRGHLSPCPPQVEALNHTA